MSHLHLVVSTPEDEMPSSVLHCDPETWIERAECRGMDPELFHPGRGGDTISPKKVCAVCPVRAECLDYSIRTCQRVGIWGGVGERARRVLIRERAGSAAHITPAAKLTEAAVREIRARRAEGVTYRVLAEQFDVSLQTIVSAARGRTWGWVS